MLLPRILRTRDGRGGVGENGQVAISGCVVVCLVRYLRSSTSNLTSAHVHHESLIKTLAAPRYARRSYTRKDGRFGWVIDVTEVVSTSSGGNATYEIEVELNREYTKKVRRGYAMVSMTTTPRPYTKPFPSYG